MSEPIEDSCPCRVVHGYDFYYECGCGHEWSVGDRAVDNYWALASEPFTITSINHNLHSCDYQGRKDDGVEFGGDEMNLEAPE